MKQLLFLLISLILLSRCKQSEPIPSPMIGDWVWTGTSGGYGGALIEPIPTQRIVLRFGMEGQFSVHQNDTLCYNGTFRLTKAHSIYSGKEELKIETRQVRTGYQQKIRQIIVIDGIVSRLSASQFSIGDNRYDGYGSSFVRK